MGAMLLRPQKTRQGELPGQLRGGSEPRGIA